MPEENNRRITDTISDLLFTTDQTANENLKLENVTGKFFLAGDIMLESLQLIRQNIDLSINTSPYVLATLHRPSNVDNPSILKQILSAFQEISEEIPIVLPVHPRTASKINEIIRNEKLLLQKVRTIEPVGYIEMLKLINNSIMVLTDSGGLQKEAVHLGKPCVVLRLETEWKEYQEKNYIHVLTQMSHENIIEKYKERFCQNYKALKISSSVSKIICDKICEDYENSNHH